MTTLTAPEDHRDLETAEPGAPRLRLRRAGRDEQIYPLEPGRWTIGSSARCNVRLPASEAQPLQCLITLEWGEAIVTRWAAGVLLNGREFSKTPFKFGDRLTIGPWEVEWEQGDEDHQDEDHQEDSLVEEAPAPKAASATPPPVPAAADPQGDVSASKGSQESPIGVDAEPADEFLSDRLSAEPAETEPQAPAATTAPCFTVDVVEPASVEEPPASLADAPQAPTPSRRQAAKTVLVASRKTDPFDQPLGPLAPAAVASTALATTASPLRPAHASEAFQDRLVVKLWRSGFAARMRTKAIVANARAARDRARQLTHLIAEFEGRLLESRAISEAHDADHQAECEALDGELTLAIAECDRLVAELDAFQTASEAQSEEVKSQRDALHAQLIQAAAERDRLIAEREAKALACDAQAAERNANLDALQTLLYEADEARERLAAELKSLRTQTDAQTAERQLQWDALKSELNEATVARDRLVAEINALREQADAKAAERQSLIESLQRDCESAASERDRLVGELDAARAVLRQTPPPDPRLQTLADACTAAEEEAQQLRSQIAENQQQIVTLQEQISAQNAAQQTFDEQVAAHANAESNWQSEHDLLNGSLQAAEAESARLRDELTACEAHLERLDEQAAQAESARAAADQQLADQQRQQSRWLAECQVLQDSHAAALANVEQQRDELQRQLAELANLPPAETAFGPEPSEELADRSDAPPSEPSESSSRGWESDEPDLSGEPELAVESAPATEISLPASPKAEPESGPPTAAAAAVPETKPARVEAAYEPASAPTSFIERYRHLLDDDAPEPAASLRKSQPILDDEYLSPAQFDDSGHADNDSDEALEAYMSNMMRRVRSTGSSVVASMAPTNMAQQHVDESMGLSVSVVEEPIEMELDANGMQRPVGKRPTIATNLAALRELANASARTAIAQHRQRRHVESAIVKGVFFVASAGVAAYLLLTAPEVGSPWYWSGCVALLAAGGAAVQLMMHFWRRLSDARRDNYAATPTAASEALAALALVPSAGGEQAASAAL